MSLSKYYLPDIKTAQYNQFCILFVPFILLSLPLSFIMYRSFDTFWGYFFSFILFLFFSYIASGLSLWLMWSFSYSFLNKHEKEMMLCNRDVLKTAMLVDKLPKNKQEKTLFFQETIKKVVDLNSFTTQDYLIFRQNQETLTILQENGYFADRTESLDWVKEYLNMSFPSKKSWEIEQQNTNINILIITKPNKSSVIEQQSEENESE